LLFLYETFATHQPAQRLTVLLYNANYSVKRQGYPHRGSFLVKSL